LGELVDRIVGRLVGPNPPSVEGDADDDADDDEPGGGDDEDQIGDGHDVADLCSQFGQV
jgi:hypothetical protein